MVIPPRTPEVVETHPKVLNVWQFELQPNVPLAKPLVMQVWLSRSVPSQASLISFVLFPHVLAEVQLEVTKDEQLEAQESVPLANP